MTDASSEDDSSFFEQVTQRAEADSGPDRIQELKRMLFDLSYLVMNADGTEHISEQILVAKLEQRMEREGSVNVDARSETLASLLEEGPDAIRQKVLELADEVADRAGQDTERLCNSYLDFLKGLIVADATVTAEEVELFELLCDHWGVQKELPQT